MNLLQEIKALQENVRELMLRQVPILIQCQNRNVDFQSDPVDINCHISSELEGHTLHIHADSDDILNLDVTRTDLVKDQNTHITLVADLSNALIIAEGDSASLKLQVNEVGEIQQIELNIAQFSTVVRS